MQLRLGNIRDREPGMCCIADAHPSCKVTMLPTGGLRHHLPLPAYVSRAPAATILGSCHPCHRENRVCINNHDGNGTSTPECHTPISNRRRSRPSILILLSGAKCSKSTANYFILAHNTFPGLAHKEPATPYHPCSQSNLPPTQSCHTCPLVRRHRPVRRV